MPTSASHFSQRRMPACASPTVSRTRCTRSWQWPSRSRPQEGDASGLPSDSEWAFRIRRLIDAHCRSAKLILRPMLETNSIEALRGFARSGARVTMLRYLATKRDVDLGLLTAVPFAG